MTKSLDGWTWIMVAAVAVLYGKEILLIAGILGAMYLVLSYTKHRQLRKDAKQANLLEDPGFDPIYPYETMPLTYPICDTFPYHDYDDGLRNWK